MKKSKKNLLTLMLAGAVCGSAIFGAAMLNDPVAASAAEVNYALTDVFAANNATEVIGSAKQNEGDAKQTTTFSLKTNDYVRIKRDLAFKWFEGREDAEYLTLKFSFKDLNFTSVSFAIESESSIASETEKARNVVTFKNDNGVISVAVVSDGMNEEAAVFHSTTITAGTDITLELTENGSEAFDEFTVLLNGDAANPIGKFTHVGANFGEYDSSTSDSDPAMYPLEITAKTGDTATVLYLDEINKQRFDNVTVTDNVSKVVDTACPVLVVNEDINGFLLGTAFSLDYEKIDVLQNASISETKRFHQYNPTKDYPAASSMKAFTTSTYFMDTTYEVDGKTTSVYQEEGREYVSLKITLGDNAYNQTADPSNAYAKKVYDLSWYALENNTAERDVVVTKTEKDGTTKTDYIVLDRNEDGPTYNYITAVETDATNKIGENKVDETALNKQVDAYNKLLKKAASEVNAGSNAYIYLPSMEWLIGDNNGYRGLKFTISYKNASNTQTASSLSYNGLKISASSVGTYEFKILATDKAGNGMWYYDKDGKKVEVTTSNIWDIEEIPYFTYTIDNQGMKVKNEESSNASDRTVTKVVDEEYSLSGITIVGGSNQKTDYALFKVDTSKYSKLTQSVLAGVTYKDIREAIAPKLPLVSTDYDGDYFALYLDVYAELLANAVNKKEDKDAIKACFTRIEKYNDRITEDDAEWEKYNKYEWQKSGTSSFKTAEEGEYLMFADYYDSLLPTTSRTAAYKLIVVDSSVDTIPGESKWLENNLTSVILFSIAAVMLILIIILLLVKPSDETLEDVDKKATLTKRAARVKGADKKSKK